MSVPLQIASKTVSRESPAYIIAEVGLAHDGSLGAAHAYIDAVAEEGVDAIKFQTHIPEEESSKYEQFRVRVFPQDKTRFDYWKRTSFEKAQWLELAAHAKECDLDFLSSPFSVLAIEWLQECSVPAWKVASGEVGNHLLLKLMAQTGKPVLLSSGMSSWKELDASVAYLQEHEADLAVFQCTTSYPCPPEKWGLNVVREMLTRYGCPVGFSDHSGVPYACHGARMVGATLLEFHIVFHRDQFGPDTKASIPVSDVGSLSEGVRQLERSLFHPLDKDQQAEQLGEMKTMFAQSLYAAKDLVAGQKILESDIEPRKPMIGVPASELPSIVGKTLSKAIASGEPLHHQDISS